MGKKKHKHEEHVDESWLVPYSDMLTLLMALFLVLFAMSSVDSAKFKQMAIALNEEFAGGTGNEEFLSQIETELEKELEEAAAKEEKDKIAQMALAEKELREREMNDLEKVKEKIDNYIAAQKLDLDLNTELTQHGLMITITEHTLFDSGSAIVKKESFPLIKEIAKFINTKPPRDVSIMGHTDNVPINTSQYESNWELSTSRATNFLKIVLDDNPNLSPKKFSASGYGEFRPVTENKTASGKAKNRRVEVMVLPLTDEELKKLYQDEFNEMLGETTKKENSEKE